MSKPVLGKRVLLVKIGHTFDVAKAVFCLPLVSDLMQEKI